MERYICIHGHFYQPPRENPWLEAIEVQDSAYPYHDWNERVTAECYAPNAVARILDERGRIAQIINNYSHISFDFGPTLLAWLAARSPNVYRAILAADQQSQKRFSGHGAALAQAYNHLILPLANERDKRTQIAWGIRDFEFRFGRKPAGMWLPETAVDVATLEQLAGFDIKFTILAPHQAKRTREIGATEWSDVANGKIDPTRAYLAKLPSGRTINLFFYDGPVARAVAFEQVLATGEDFANRLMGAFSDQRQGPQLVHIATDGESYGHHHHHGDMALAYALHYLADKQLVQLTNYSEFLEKYPAQHEVEIHENSSWSCVHGVERWRSNCGCNMGGHADWNQKWRAPLRAAFDWLRDTLAPLYENQTRTYLTDPWAARDEYINIVLARSAKSRERFLRKHSARELSEADQIAVWRLLEMQRHLLLMYTSCGWFFDELSGLETVQVIQYASRALQLAEDLFGDNREEQFLQRLEQARSNIAEHKHGRQIYEKFVRPARINLKGVAAHYAVSSLFEKYPRKTAIYCYATEREAFQRWDARRVRLAIGRAKFTSQITGESATLAFGALHLGDHQLHCGVRQAGDEAPTMALSQVFAQGDWAEVIRQLDKQFGESTYSLRSLFRDEQRQILRRVLTASLNRAETLIRQTYERRASLMRFVTDGGMPLPKAFQAAAEFTINLDLRRACEAPEPDAEQIRNLVAEARALHVPLDQTALEFSYRKRLETLMDQLLAQPTSLELLEKLRAALNPAGMLPFEFNLWTVENSYYEFRQAHYAEFQANPAWVKLVDALGEQLGMKTP